MNIALERWDEHVAYRVSERAYLLYTEGHYRESLTLFEGLLEIYPSNLYYRDSVSALYLSLGDPAEAVRQASILIDVDSSYPNAFMRRCEGHLSQGLFSEAERDLARLEQLGALLFARRMKVRIGAAKRAHLARTKSA